MGLVIALGSGLVVGIGLLIWALGERNARHAAERARDEAVRARERAADVANANAAKAVQLEEQVIRLNSQIDTLHGRLHDIREAVTSKASIPVLRKLLATEGDKEVI
jgi:predicted  nucleic acid-binding Zn-ribbon protein